MNFSKLPSTRKSVDTSDDRRNRGNQLKDDGNRRAAARQLRTGEKRGLETQALRLNDLDGSQSL
jgi:hypothetical protein